MRMRRVVWTVGTLALYQTYICNNDECQEGWSNGKKGGLFCRRPKSVPHLALGFGVWQPCQLSRQVVMQECLANAKVQRVDVLLNVAPLGLLGVHICCGDMHEATQP